MVFTRDSLIRRMPSSRMLRHVAFIRIVVSEKCIASVIRMTTIAELGTTSAVTINGNTLMFLRNVGSYKSHTA
jgi:hypothetical protein